jgi:hypothetical protein
LIITDENEPAGRSWATPTNGTPEPGDRLGFEFEPR